MKTLAELQEIERQLEKSLETVREAMREQINRDGSNKKSEVMERMPILPMKTVYL